MLVRSPASRARSRNHARAARCASENVVRWIPPSGVAPKRASASKSARRRSWSTQSCIASMLQRRAVSRSARGGLNVTEWTQRRHARDSWPAMRRQRDTKAVAPSDLVGLVATSNPNDRCNKPHSRANLKWPFRTEHFRPYLFSRATRTSAEPERHQNCVHGCSVAKVLAPAHTLAPEAKRLVQCDRRLVPREDMELELAAPRRSRPT